MTSRITGNQPFASFLGRCLLGVIFCLSGAGVQAQGVSISGGGTPSYSIPIAVPPGIGGMTPNIGLLYSASGINGPVGYGWTVQGISMITRCSGNKRIDGVARSVDYSPNDKLCLDGQRLIQTDAAGTPLSVQQNDSMGGSVREYRTDKDIYARIRSYGSNGDLANGPAYFRVWTKSGQIYEYGNAPSGAQIVVTGRAMLAAWAVSRISDTVGNYMDFQYEQADRGWGSGPAAGSPTLGHEWNLKEIRYTGNGGQQPVNKVVFSYLERPAAQAGLMQDRAEAYHQGGKNVSIQLLDKISTYINWPASQGANASGSVHVKTVKLTYDNGPTSGRSRLVNVRECANAEATKCLPATSFNYAAGGGVNYVANAAFSGGVLATAVMQRDTGNYGVLVGNFFGNGRSSILRWSDVPGENQIFRSEGDGRFTQIPSGGGAGQFNITDQNLFSSNGCYSSITADFNGDGLTDILRARNSDSGGCASVQNILYLSNGDGSFRANVVSGIDLVKMSSTTQDLYYCSSNRPGDISCPDEPPYQGTTRTRGQNYYLLDVNNDGLLDIVTTILVGYEQLIPPSEALLCARIVCSRVFLGQTNGTFVEQLNTNLTHVSIYGDPRNSGYGARPYTMDVNGDGLSDFVVNGGVWLSRGDGNFDSNPDKADVIPCALPLDFNGDGRSDCLDLAPYAAHPQSLMVADGTYVQQKVGNFNLAGFTLIDDYLSTKQTMGVQTADFDGDGRSDILYWNEDASKNIIYLSNGDGTFRSGAFNLTGAANQLQKSDGTASFILGDFTGRGNTEILRMVSWPAIGGIHNELYVKTDSTPPDQLLSVVSATGLKTALTWVPLTNSSSGSLGQRYASDRGTPNAAVYPVVDLTLPTYVVATVTADTGVASHTQVTDYAYAGLKMAYDGRGWLGFRSNLQQKMTPNDGLMTVTTQNIQNGPNPGPASVTETRLGALNVPDAQLLSRSTFIYCDKTAAAGAEAVASSATPCATTAKVQRPYLYKSTEEGWDLTGAILPDVTTVNQFNNSGDAVHIAVTTVGSATMIQTSVKHTFNEYFPETTANDSWILGRLKAATVTSSVSNSLGGIPSSAGSAPNATATRGTGGEPGVTPLTPAVNPAVLMSIIMSILGDD